MRIRALGPLDLESGVDVTRKTRQVITLLALAAPNALSAERIADALWDEPPPAAIKTVQAHVSRARAALPGAIVGTSSGYALAWGREDVDVLAVVALQRDARSVVGRSEPARREALLREARALFRGEPELPSTVLGDAARARVLELHGIVVEEHLRAMVDADRAADALVEIDAAVGADPLRESLWGLRMLALYRAGRQADALRSYQEVRAVLAEELGVEPGPDLRRLEASILAHDPALAPTARDAVGTISPSILPRYAVADGRQVAYASFGAGVADLLLLMPGFITIDAYLEEPHLAAALQRLAVDHRVLALDRSGIGLSDPFVAEHEPTLEDWLADVVAVLDDAAATTVDVLANADTGLLALLLAARHPARVSTLTLLDPYARLTRADDYPFGFSTADVDAIRAAVRNPGGATGADQLALVAPTMADDLAFRAWWDRVGRRSASPRTADRLLAVVGDADVRSILTDVVAPAAVVLRRGCPSYDAQHGRYLASRLANVEVIESDEADDLWWLGNDGLLDHLDRITRANRATR